MCVSIRFTIYIPFIYLCFDIQVNSKPLYRLPNVNSLVHLAVSIHISFTLSQKTNFRLFQTEIVSDEIFTFDENEGKFFNRVENTVVILLFPQCFQKTCTADT